MEQTAEQVVTLLTRGRLMDAEGAKSVHDQWKAEAGPTATQASAFLKWLVAHRFVTDYQANLLSKGHGDDYFLGPYKILERIGRGRMAGVYRAVHNLGQMVAIKVLPPSKAANPQLLGRFQREALLAQRLRHANVVRSFQVGETKGLHYLVMEYVEGETLDEVLAKRRHLPPHEAVRLIHQALLGLQHLHEQGLVHRDLKPANLILTPPPSRSGWATSNSTVKILDIGLARELFDESSPDAATQAELTAEGVLLGTPDYLAPEQARDPRTIDIRADIYSMGCVLYHTLAGQPPFPDKNILSQMVRHATETPASLSQFNSHVPEGLEQIVRWMMAKDPAQRYPTPARAAQALEMFLLAGAASAETVETPEMLNYLTWLEGGGPNKSASSPAAAHARATAVTPRPAPAEAAVEFVSVADSAASSASSPPKNRTSPPPSQPAEEEFDVELIPLPESALSPSLSYEVTFEASPEEVASRNFDLEVELSRSAVRDWACVLIGAGALLFLIFFALLVANLVVTLTEQ